MAYFAATLARPVVLGHMTLAAAHAAIIVAIDAGMQKGDLPGNGTLEERVHIDNHILELNIRNAEAEREKATGAIIHALRPLIGIRAPRNRLLAEAHDINADHDFPLTESEVAEITAVAVWQAIQQARRYG
jgi:hypothetical protein